MTAQEPEDEITPGIIGSGLFRTRENIDADVILRCWSKWRYKSDRAEISKLEYKSPLGRLMASVARGDGLPDVQVVQAEYDCLEPHMEAVDEIVQGMSPYDHDLLFLHYIHDPSLKVKCEIVARAEGLLRMSRRTYDRRVAEAKDLFLVLGGARYL